MWREAGQGSQNSQSRSDNACSPLVSLPTMPVHKQWLFFDDDDSGFNISILPTTAKV